MIVIHLGIAELIFFTRWFMNFKLVVFFILECMSHCNNWIKFSYRDEKLRKFTAVNVFTGKFIVIFILQISQLMDRFETQFENLDVQSQVMENTMMASSTLTTPQGEVDALMSQAADEAGYVSYVILSSVQISGYGDTGVQVSAPIIYTYRLMVSCFVTARSSLWSLVVRALMQS